MTTLQQRRLYWPTWQKAAKKLTAAGFTKAEIDQKRLDLHQHVTGSRCSSKTLTNRQLDIVLDLFYIISGTPTQKTADQPEIRLRHQIRSLGFSEPYIRATANNIVGCGIDLAIESQLRKILIALKLHATRQKP